MAKMKEASGIYDSIGKINNKFQCLLFEKYVSKLFPLLIKYY